ncbi:MAG: PAS domain-containing protein [Deltaproteobacteria bacterium]|nr:PAS domain-containing protein [Deltaproteobacteria bacterium]
MASPHAAPRIARPRSALSHVNGHAKATRVDAGESIHQAPPLIEVAAPTGRERLFDAEELLVSKTDLNGRITYANDAFLEVAGFTQAEMIGQPHSVVRHPDMPRGVFNLLWAQIQSGKEIFAYVVNRCKNGDHYWVLAHVTPTFGVNGQIVGYHSNRRCPERAQVTYIKGIYDQMLAAERGHARKADAIAASTKVLEAVLAEKGMPYDEFIFSF